MKKPPYTILQMNAEDVQNIAIRWAEEEGWNPGIEDAKAFYAQDPHGFFKGKLGNQIIGCCSAVVYDDNFAFFGFYIVKSEYRHQGYGIQMTRHRLEYVGNRNIGLDGVVNMCDKYANIGFRPAHMNIRFQRQGALIENQDPHVIPISEHFISEVEKYDRSYFPAPRNRFLQHWLRQTQDRISLAYMDNEKIKGYGVIRRCFSGFKIGPLFAESYEIAEKIFKSLMIQSKGNLFFLDIPKPNEKALKLVERYQMKESFRTLRMYTKGAPDINLDHVYGITTFELG